MSRSSFRPQVELLDGRCLPSASPAITITDAVVEEDNSGQTALVFTVTLSKASSKLVSVNYATADGTAEAGSDFASKAGTLTFAPGEKAKTITVLVNGDTDIEAHERFTVNLSGARNASIADAQGVGSIYNDDLLPGTAIDPGTGLLYVPADPPPGDGGCDPNGPYFCP
jgi:hypothetical protein